MNASPTCWASTTPRSPISTATPIRFSPHFTDGEKALLDLAAQIGEDANRVSKELWERLHKHWSEPQIVDVVFVITIYIAVSKFGDALEPMFDGVKPVLFVEH